MADIDAALDPRPTIPGQPKPSETAARTLLRAFAAARRPTEPEPPKPEPPDPKPPKPQPPKLDWGQPIDELPPLVEPVAVAGEAPAPLPSGGPRPPRRSFLAPIKPPAAAGQAPPAPVGPVGPGPQAPPAPQAPPPGPTAAAARAAPPPARPVQPAPVAPSAAAPARRRWEWRPWLAPAGSLLTAARRRPRAVAGGIVIVCVVILGLYVLGGQAISPSHRTMVSAAVPPGDPTQRLAYYQEAAKAGDPETALRLAILYAKGEGVPQDYATAARWFQAAADKGVARAQYDLGVLYERGRGVPADFAIAANWYQKAAEGHFPLAEYNLAVAYTKGQGIRQDLNEAASWYRRAAGHGVVQAMINLAVLYERGDGVTASPADAYAWYLAAGQRGNAASARRAEELLAVLTRVDQVRAQAMAADVAASIHDPKPEATPGSGAGPDPVLKSGIDNAPDPSPPTPRAGS